ncbi:hypothetical protein T265_09977 [Opisthorchis viverrini]|uniref:Uncharacterized protein n=1 Tax=Opisthorchis viverrini TaxID=6198 RepID=A0A074ZEW1_OPIVI|nr:hypothetical protein T265_09977 [Opisthorchis viverrini]KER21770.1 hypothetical protein T265_09977 [Opisthorchis viverrini]
MYYWIRRSKCKLDGQGNFLDKRIKLSQIGRRGAAAAQPITNKQIEGHALEAMIRQLANVEGYCFSGMAGKKRLKLVKGGFYKCHLKSELLHVETTMKCIINCSVFITPINIVWREGTAVVM